MSEIGKSVRLGNIINQRSKRMVVVAMDHGPIMGPVPGLIDPVDTIKRVVKGKPDAIMLHKGNVRAGHSYLVKAGVPFILNITTSVLMGPVWDKTTLIDEVETAVRLGASSVTIRTLLGTNYDTDMLNDFGMVSLNCDKWGMPLFAMIYPDGTDNPKNVVYVKHAARVAAELGADVIKTHYTGSAESFKEVVDCSTVPVVMSGGEKTKDPAEFLKIAKGVVEAGAAGVMVGRNLFEYKDPAAMLRAIKAIVHDGKTVQEASVELEK
ncbi:MAG: 2-amino-3,7-dideoxy-D-threo-hept-6-ulosonate synthase [Dehalococcoidia bacterium]|nr:2-amino-3,7-dideoxy-D-threo-hept-6-ulosonate synthase [Dehalococcoidia bacterium]